MYMYMYMYTVYATNNVDIELHSVHALEMV